jgi:hypothetical protein
LSLTVSRPERGALLEYGINRYGLYVLELNDCFTDIVLRHRRPGLQ